MWVQQEPRPDWARGDVFLPLSPVRKWPGDPVTPSKRHFALVPHVDAVQTWVFFVCFITSLNLPPISGKYWKWLKDPLWLSSHKSNGPTISHQSVSLNLSSSAFKRQSHEFAFWWVLLERVLMFVPILSLSTRGDPLSPASWNLRRQCGKRAASLSACYSACAGQEVWAAAWWIWRRH